MENGNVCTMRKDRAKEFRASVDALESLLRYDEITGSVEAELLNLVRVNLATAFLMERFAHGRSDDLPQLLTASFATILRDTAVEARSAFGRYTRELDAAKRKDK